MGSASRAWCLYGGRGQPACRACRAARLTVGPGAGGGGCSAGRVTARGGKPGQRGGVGCKCQRAVTEANPSLFIHLSLEGHMPVLYKPLIFSTGGERVSGCHVRGV